VPALLLPVQDLFCSIWFSTCHHRTTRCRQISFKLHAPICRSRQGLVDRFCFLPASTVFVPRRERPAASSSWRRSGYDSRLQGSGSKSRITRCGCFRIARSQRPAGCDFPKLLMDTTQASACSFGAACKLPPARSNTPAQTKRATLDLRRYSRIRRRRAEQI
jgi:hypothetical protein